MVNIYVHYTQMPLSMAKALFNSCRAREKPPGWLKMVWDTNAPLRWLRQPRTGMWRIDVCVCVSNHNPLYTRNASLHTSSAHTKRRERCDWYWFLCKCSICKCTTRYNLHSHSVSAVYNSINPAPLSLEQLLTQSQRKKNNARKWDMTAHVCICTPGFVGDGSQTWKAIFV